MNARGAAEGKSLRQTSLSPPSLSKKKIEESKTQRQNIIGVNKNKIKYSFDIFDVTEHDSSSWWRSLKIKIKN